MLKPPYCNSCILGKISRGFSKPEGRGTSGVLLAGEALGHEEYLEGFPFRPHAEAGSTLERAIRALGMSRDQFKLWNIIACQPPGNKLEGKNYEEAAIAHCRGFFDSVMRRWNPGTKNRVIVAMGNIAARELAGVTGDASENQSITWVRGYVYWNSRYNCYVVPAYHPSFIRRGNMAKLDSLKADILRAVQLARGEYISHQYDDRFVKPKYNLHASIDDLNSLKHRLTENSRMLLAVDIETDTSANVLEDMRADNTVEAARIAQEEITQIQFSTKAETGLAVPFQRPYLELIYEILALENTKIGHNFWLFDGKKLENAGARIGGKVHDTMWMYKTWNPRLDRHLQAVAGSVGFPFPWKHLFGQNFQFYGCADVDAPMRIIADLPKRMKEMGVWKCYLDHVFGMRPIYARAEKVGITVDEEKRKKLEDKLRGIRDEKVLEIQKAVPKELRGLRPKRKIKDREGEFSYGYVREPKRVLEALRKRYDNVTAYAPPGRKIASFETFTSRIANLEKVKLTEWDIRTGEETTVERWCQILPFLPTSSKQVMEYLVWKRGEIEKEIERIRQTGEI